MFRLFVLPLLLLCACNGQSKNDKEQSTENIGVDTGLCIDNTEETNPPTSTQVDDTVDNSTDSDVHSGPLSEAAYQALLASGILVQEADVFTTSYHEGYNLNFEITQDQARSLLPENLTPVKMKILASDPEPLYYLSMYMAVLDSNESPFSFTRIDLFTYAANESDELALNFVSSFMSMPDAITSNEELFNLFKEMFDFFALDSQTGKPAYPHYYTDTLFADHDTFNFAFNESYIKLSACEPVTQNERLASEFVMANSQIYRTAIDKNVNYFNQSFINAKVETRNLNCVEYKNLGGFHPMLKDLRSIQFYGSKDKKITWYYQMCTKDDCTSPFN
ncbi:MAG: hypothetical protein MUC50_22400 [Myxococcota bacterium]|jgi:hypothetical protein|nr:hypothetical protein [Myxococcota bacterium]